MLWFKRETYKDVTAIEDGSINDLTAYLYCCIVSACRADGVDFGYSLEDFADALMPEDLELWTKGLQGDGSKGADDVGSGGKKK